MNKPIWPRQSLSRFLSIQITLKNDTEYKWINPFDQGKLYIDFFQVQSTLKKDSEWLACGFIYSYSNKWNAAHLL